MKPCKAVSSLFLLLTITIFLCTSGVNSKDYTYCSAMDIYDQTYCIAMDDVDLKTLETALDWVCGPAGRVNCSEIQPGKNCYESNDVKSLASYAFDSYYQSQGKAPQSCDFNGAATITTNDPSHGSCIFPGRKELINKKQQVDSTQSCNAGAMDTSDQTYCVAKDGVDSETLLTSLDWVCGPGGANCSEIQPGENCYEPNDVKKLASYAFDSYYQSQGKSTESCDFNGAATITTNDPSHGSCIFPGRKELSNKKKQQVKYTQSCDAGENLKPRTFRDNILDFCLVVLAFPILLFLLCLGRTYV